MKGKTLILQTDPSASASASASAYALTENTNDDDQLVGDYNEDADQFDEADMAYVESDENNGDEEQDQGADKQQEQEADASGQQQQQQEQEQGQEQEQAEGAQDADDEIAQVRTVVCVRACVCACVRASTIYCAPFIAAYHQTPHSHAQLCCVCLNTDQLQAQVQSQESSLQQDREALNAVLKSMSHTHTHANTRKHTCSVLPFICFSFNMCVHVRACVCVCVRNHWHGVDGSQESREEADRRSVFVQNVRPLCFLFFSCAAVDLWLILKQRDRGTERQRQIEPHTSHRRGMHHMHAHLR